MMAAVTVACGPAAQDGPMEEAGARSALELGSSELPQADAAESLRPAADAPLVPAIAAPLKVDESAIEYDAKGIEVGFTEDGHAYRGSLAAPVVIQEFSDFQCPYCARFFDSTLPALDENQIATGNARLVYYDFPLSNIHPQATAAAVATRCAGEQGAAAYWAMHDAIFQSTAWHGAEAREQFLIYAGEIGLDRESFADCQESSRYRDEIQADLDYGLSNGINSTPSFLINGQPLVGAQPYAVFARAIAAVTSGESIADAGAPATQPSQPAAKPTPVSISYEDSAAFLGDPTAPVTIVEFTDYQCGFCQRHNVETMPLMLSELIETGQVRYVLKDYPLDSIHPLARSAAIAARCAGEQDAYWEMHDAIFQSQSDWEDGDSVDAEMAELVASIGLDSDAFQACIASGRHQSAVQANVEEGASLGVRGTPFFFVNGFPINGAQPFELFEYAVELASEGTLADAYGPREEPEQTAPPQPSGPIEVPVAGSPSIGDPDAPVTIVEYTDYQCPFCSRHFEQTVPRLKENFIDTGLVHYVFKDFPLTSIHAQAVEAAEAARCAGEQADYAGMHDLLFARQSAWSGRADAAQLFNAYALELGLDETSFANCMQNHTYQAAVTADLEEGIGFGVRGTPAFFLNGHFVSGAQPYEMFEQAINQLLSDG
jgi:protein-disulfide isomerase